MKKIAIIVAGGIGSRMNHSTPKQFLLIKGKPVLFYTLDAFLKSDPLMDIILVLPQEFVAAGQEIIDAFFDYTRIKITGGGRTRFHSVQNGLKLINEESVVFVHDAVRCLVTEDLINRCYDAVLSYGSAIPVVDSRDSIRILTEDGNEALDREMVKLVQTPQVFYSKILLPAFNIDYKDKFTDEASVVEAFGLKVYLIQGEENNIKVTYPSDLVFVENILDERKS
jgi:2-C-methyl-D-erythritol 4-phosphate cytidylyltransferase